ncbi:MAG: PBP1A family penicillin-binding protein [Desulfobacteraceae bacterium]|nr:MAG: PBP1A family penicillin-binding protein [Desulfobacteraceae bacterium]
MTRFLFQKNKMLICLITACGIIAGTAGGILIAVTRDLPEIRSLQSYQPSAVTRIYSEDRVLLSELFLEKRDPLRLNDIPISLRQAVIAIEDRNFYRHSGVDLKGIARAVIKDILARKFVEGASTLTQQLAKTLFLTHKKTIIRKLKEAILAFQLERRYTKDEILELYLNQVYFGSGAYGVKAAAKTFFNKPVGELTLAEAALIAGMPQSPSRLSPLINPERAVQRRDIVLKQMMRNRIISQKEFQQAANEPLRIGQSSDNHSKAPYFTRYVMDQLEREVGSTLMYHGGLIVHTTLNYELQNAAETAVRKRLPELEDRMKNNHITAPAPQAAVISLDIQTGGILTMVGGRDFSQSSYNRAVTAKRQPGSAFKTILFAYAAEQGFPQNMLILDSPVIFPGPGDSPPWEPENFTNDYMGEITLRKALAYSKNIPAVRLIEKVGVAPVVSFAYSLGIQSPLHPYLSLALGTAEMTLMELTTAYSVFPNQGKRIKPFAITEVQDRQGRIILRAKPQKTIVMSRTGAAIITDMLTGVIQEGTGRKAEILRRPLAGKTGTTNQYKDALFIGFSPSITTGVWVGQDSAKTLGSGETGARAALPIWMDIMKAAESKTYPGLYFDTPDGTVRVRIDPVSGNPVPENTPGSVNALFIKGTEPEKFRSPAG